MCTTKRPRRLAWLLAVPGALLAACSGGSSDQTSSTSFSVEGISVSSGDTWRLNRPIDIAFSTAIDFSTVNFNTIRITSTSGEPAVGRFLQLNDRTVRFLAACPTQSDHSDAGLKPGGVAYILTVAGSQTGGITVLATDGRKLETSRSVNFQTPASEAPQELFLDTVPGPPVARLRGRTLDGDQDAMTYLELGGDASNRVYFRWDGQMGVLEDEDLQVPINHYSIQANRVAVVVHLNQPVSPADDNINSSMIQLEYRVDDGPWLPVASSVELVENCTDTGAAVRVEPIGLLPRGMDLRVNLRQGFRDLVDDRSLLDLTNFANMVTASSAQDADEVLEPFLVGGDGPDSLEDTLAPFATPRAIWGEDELASAFEFGGSGGPGGNFDWHIPNGQDFVLDTTSDQITGGPGGIPVLTQAVIGGVVDVRNLVVPATSALIINGPNPLTVLASGTVDVFGEIIVNGTSNKGVTTLNTTNQPEPGGSGQGGGGTGGTGSFLTNQSTPRGGAGRGAFGVSSGGGQGGETSYGEGGGNVRRGAGGGGGSFGPDYFYRWRGGPYSLADPSDLVRCQEMIGLDGERGFGGGIDPGRGAESQIERARGGRIAVRPFFDERSENDFLGTMLTVDGEIIQGELDRVWAGSGGGGGGDAVDSSSFPLTPFSVSGDEKGSGGGGGAGGLTILAIGEVVVHDGGRILAEGGQGGGGENTTGFNRIGGGSGGGAGGHIVLSSASFISISGYDEAEFGPWYHDGVNGHVSRAISAIGGEGGAGKQNRGGSQFNGEKQPWRCDVIPNDYYLTEDKDLDGCIDRNPPGNDLEETDEGGDPCPGAEACQKQHPDKTDPLGTVLSAGGDGTPGLIQLHVDNPADDIRFPELPGQLYGVEGPTAVDATLFFSPPPVGWSAPEVAADVMIPFFGALSTAQSRWIPLGLARIGRDSSGGPTETTVAFQFGGTDAADGTVSRDGDLQRALDPILGPAQLQPPESGLPALVDAFTIAFDASGLADDIYKLNPNLTKSFQVVLSDTFSPENTVGHEVASAAYDADADQLILTVSMEGPALTDFRSLGATEASLVPYYFVVTTNGQLLSYPEQTEIRLTFEATVADAEGHPSDSDGTGFVSDITEFNDDMVHYDFFRFRVEFNLNTFDGSVDLSTPKPAIGFFRVPFRF